MDVDQSNRAPIAFRESCRAAFYTILVLVSPFVGLLAVLTIALFYHELRMIAACCVSAAAILAVVRWVNHRDTARHAKLPFPTADSTEFTGPI
jgi:hypothetical protein